MYLAQLIVYLTITCIFLVKTEEIDNAIMKEIFQNGVKLAWLFEMMN